MLHKKQTYQYMLIGLLAGLANGFFGSGGGLFLVPLLTRWTGLTQRQAFATSVAVILPLSIASVAIYFHKGAIDFLSVLPYLLGGTAGGILSGRIFQKVSLTLLRRIFGILILYGGIRALLLL